jgi:hypothetical protein
MPRLIRILCLLVCVNLVVAPLSHVHAHVSGEEHDHVSVHGGHDHAFTYDHHVDHDHAPSVDHLDHADDQESGSRAIDLSGADAVKPNIGVKSLVWIAVLCVILFAIPSFPVLRAIRPPPRNRALPLSPYPHALPLLRGPPRSI